MENLIDQEGDKNIVIHTVDDFVSMRIAGKLASQVLDYITDFVVPGVTTGYLNDLCHNFIVKHGAVPAPLNYKGFPKSICTSLNHVVCHGIPDDTRQLLSGDILNIDVTVILDGWHGDTSRMFAVGKINVKAKKLMETAFEAMMEGISIVRPGENFATIGRKIQEYVEGRGYSVVRDFCGHGIGRVFHASPNVLHYYSDEYSNLIMEEGMFFTIEPMINAGKYHVKILRDEWTAVTCDKSLSAQWEHTVGVTADGFEIFTIS